jgi:hypothetical protein
VIGMRCEADLLQVIGALHTRSGLSNPSECRKRQPDAESKDT